MKNNQEISLEKEAAKIQKMSLKQWRETIDKPVVLFQNNGEIIAAHEPTDEKEGEAASLQKLSLKALRHLHQQALPNLAEKMMLTGLSKEVIEKLETQKQKATLEEIIIYCSRLHIPFRDFLPELFTPQISISK
jgi:hypothetical protein